MFQFITFRKRNQYLAIVSLFFTLCIYLFAIKNTIAEYKLNRILKHTLEEVQIAPQEIRSLEKKLVELDGKLNFSIADSSNQGFILEVLSEVCRKNSLVLKEFSEAIPHQKNNLTIVTNVVLIEGTFHNLINMIYELEKNAKIGKLASLNFFSYKDNKKMKTILYLKIYLQNIRPFINA